MLDAFSNDAVLGILRNPLTASRMARMCEVFLDKIKEAQTLSVVPEPFKSVFSTMQQALSGVLAIYTPIPSYGGSCVKDAVDLLSFDGDNTTLETFRTVVESTDEWREQADDLLKCASASMRLSPELKRLTTDNLCKVNSPEFSSEYEAALRASPAMTKELREGALTDLEELLCRRSKCIVEALLSKTDATDVDPAHVACVSRGLNLLARYSGMPDLLSRFNAWQEKVSNTLATKQLQVFIRDAVDGCSEVDCKVLDTLLRRCGREGKEAVPSVEGIRELVPAMCKGFLEKAMSLDRVFSLACSRPLRSVV